jgi:hypothetical protein
VNKPKKRVSVNLLKIEILIDWLRSGTKREINCRWKGGLKQNHARAIADV